MQQQRYALAIAEFEREPVESSVRPHAQGMMALGYLCNQQRKAAWEVVERLMANTPDFAFAYYVAALVARHYQPTRKTKWYFKHLRILPESGEEKERLRAARGLVLEAIRLSPNTAAYFATLSELESCLGHYGASLDAAERGLAIDPEELDCANLRAAALLVVGDPLQAADTVAKALSANPEHAMSHESRGWLDLAEGDTSGAEAHFREALRVNPNDSGAKFNLWVSLCLQLIPLRLPLRFLGWISGGMLAQLLVTILLANVLVLLLAINHGQGIERILVESTVLSVAITIFFRPFITLRLLSDRSSRRRVAMRDKVILFIILGVLLALIIGWVIWTLRYPIG